MVTHHILCFMVLVHIHEQEYSVLLLLHYSITSNMPKCISFTGGYLGSFSSIPSWLLSFTHFIPYKRILFASFFFFLILLHPLSLSVCVCYIHSLCLKSSISSVHSARCKWKHHSNTIGGEFGSWKLHLFFALKFWMRSQINILQTWRTNDIST